MLLTIARVDCLRKSAIFWLEHPNFLQQLSDFGFEFKNIIG